MDRERLKKRILGEPDDFVSFLKELLGIGRIEDDTALGIAKFIVSNSPEQLSNKQWYTFLEKGLLEFNYVETCKRCTFEIPWSEMFEAVYEDSYCSYCRHKIEKDE